VPKVFAVDLLIKATLRAIPDPEVVVPENEKFVILIVLVALPVIVNISVANKAGTKPLTEAE